MRAIPEKTLEHWTSMYLARRFRDCRLWWPALGEDIRVEDFTGRPGKSVVLEIKTTDWDHGRNEHRLTLDVHQLRRYQHYAVPVYYAFPVPPWDGVLDETHSWLGSRSRSALLDPGANWFGNWVYVTSAKNLWTWLAWRRSQATAGLFTAGGGTYRVLTPWLPTKPWWRWADFWNLLATCGTPDMPALFSCSPSGGSDFIQGRGDLKERLARESATAPDQSRSANVQRYISMDEADTYRRLDAGEVLTADDYGEYDLATITTGRTTVLVELSATDLDV